MNKFSLKSKIIILLLGVSLFSIATGSILSWLRFKILIEEQVFTQLTSIKKTKSYHTEYYFENLRNQLEILSENQILVTAISEFNTAFQELENYQLSSNINQEVKTFYEETFFPKLAQNREGEQIYSNYSPLSKAGIYLQYHYLVKNPFSLGEKNKLNSAKDNSNYSQVHNKYHSILQDLVKKFGYNDLFLIDYQTEAIIYSVYKETDYATNLQKGAYSRSNLASVVNAVKDNPAKGLVHVTDFQSYTPSYGEPAAFLAIPIYDNTQITGILAVQLPIDKLNSILIEDNAFQGLGNTGEVYLFGNDYLMRSQARLLKENPQKYSQQIKKLGLPELTIKLIENYQSSVFLQPVDRKIANLAISGDSGNIITENNQGKLIFSSYSPLDIKGLQWGIIAQIEADEVFEPLYSFLSNLVVISAITAALILGISNLASRNLIKPIQSLINLGDKIQAGNYDIKAQLNRNDELQELAQSINHIIDRVQIQSQLVEEKSQKNKSLLLNILPDVVVERLNQGEQSINDSVSQATVVATRIVGLDELATQRNLAEIAEIFNQLINSFDGLAIEYGIEKQNTIGAGYIGICGLSVAYLDHEQRCVRFTFEMLEAIESVNAKYETNLGLRIAIHSGALSASIIGKQKFAYQVWGETIDNIIKINQAQKINNILVTQSLQEKLTDQYLFIKHYGVDNEAKGKIQTWMLMTPKGTFSKQVDLVQDSFVKLLPQMDSTGELFYDRLFKVAPQVRRMFKKDMKTQHQNLMSTLQIAVNGLRNLETLLPIVQDLGRKHVGYHVVPEQYDLVAEVLIWTLEQQLAQDFTPSVKVAWRTALSLIINVMKDAAMSVSDLNVENKKINQAV